MRGLASELAALKARFDRLSLADPAEAVDPAAWDFYAESCPCEGVPAGKCRIHHRARPEQRPPDGDGWKTWLTLCGRAWGKTRTGAEWVNHLAATGQARRIALVAPTAADIRGTMVLGESGIVTVAAPWNRPRYEPANRRLVWPNGTIATTYSADAPERLRGPNHHAAWVDELCSFRYPTAWDMLMFGLRIGERPRVLVTTTPKPTTLLKSLIEDPGTAMVRGSTHDNREHLAESFFDKIIATYEGTRLGAQELHAELLDVSEGAWFARFDPGKHITDRAEYSYGSPVYLAIDAGTSQTTAAVWYQCRPSGPHTHRVTVFGDFITKGGFSEANAKAIKRHGEGLPCAGLIDAAYIDPAADHNTSLGPNAFNEYARIFGPKLLSRSPRHLVADGLDQMEVMLDRGDLLLHPRAVNTKLAFQNYRRAQRGGEFLNEPAADQSPFEDSMDALRYAIRSRFPEGRIDQRQLRQVPARRLF